MENIGDMSHLPWTHHDTVGVFFLFLSGSRAPAPAHLRPSPPRPSPPCPSARVRPQLSKREHVKYLDMAIADEGVSLGGYRIVQRNKAELVGKPARARRLVPYTLKHPETPGRPRRALARPPAPHANL